MKQQWFYQLLTLDFTSFDTVYEEIENTQKSTSAYWHDHLSKKHSFDWLSWAELAVFLWSTIFTEKTAWLTNYGYLHLSFWEIFLKNDGNLGISWKTNDSICWQW